jgi:hypothetical protein
MNDLSDLAIKAHDGLERWKATPTIEFKKIPL